MMRVAKYLIFLFILSLCGCLDFTPGAIEYNEIAKIHGASNTASINKLSSYPIEKQIEIYLYGNCCVEGGTWIDPLFTKDGAKKIPFIIKRISVFPDDIRNKVALIEALNDINNDCKCLKNNSEYIQILEDVGERIKTEKSSLEYQYKESYIKFYWNYLNRIKEQ